MTLKQFSDKELMIMIAIIMFSLTIIIFFSYKMGYENGIIESYNAITQSYENLTCINTYNSIYNQGWAI